MNKLAVAYLAAGKPELAIAHLEEALKLRNATLPPDHLQLLSIIYNLAVAYDATGKFDLALPLLRDLLTISRKALPKDSPQLAGQMASIGRLLIRAKSFDEAEPPLRESHSIREKSQPELWSTFNVKSMLGGSLLGQNKYAEAEPLLLAGYEGMKQREKTMPPEGKVRLTESLERLVELYEATDKPEAAAKWRSELEARKTVEKPPTKKP